MNGIEDQTGLSVGTYYVTVTSSNGCSKIDTINLIGPGNCGLCPLIGSLSVIPTPICKQDSFKLIAAELTDMGITYGILFKYSATPLSDPYVGGTTIGTVTNSQLTSGGTMAMLTSIISTPGTYFVYAILNPVHTDPACRPFISASIRVIDCGVSISDPCACFRLTRRRSGPSCSTF